MYLFFPHLILSRGIPQVATAQTSSAAAAAATRTSMHRHTQTHAISAQNTRKSQQHIKNCEDPREKFSANYSNIHRTNAVKVREKKETLKQTIISRKANTVQHCCPQTFVVRTFETKRASKQVNRQDTVFTISCSPSAEEFDLFLLYILQCHKHNAVSRSFKGPSVTGLGGKDQIFISKTQNGNLNEIQRK